MKTYFKNKIEPYYSLWTDKNDFQMGKMGTGYIIPYFSGLERKNDFIFKILNKDKKTTNYFSKKNMGKKNNDKLVKKNNNTKEQKNTNLNDNISIVKKIEVLSNNEKENNNIDIKEEKNSNDNNENFDDELEKLFNTNQKNFFKARKDIMEEPEYLEEDNDNNDKVKEEK